METAAPVYEWKPFALVLAAVIVLEVYFRAFPGAPLLASGIARILESGVIIAAAIFFYPQARLPGIVPAEIRTGVLRGIMWSVGFGCTALAVGAVLYAVGFAPLEMIRSNMPETTAEILIFLAIGGVVSPFAEELVFRGVIFGLLRRWGAFAAVAGSALLFALAHNKSGLPVTQTVGGLVFALSYEKEKNLLVPVVIHISGNLALFAISLV
ncbi:MAG: CPBP family intramembrane metalloprotease [Desulfobacteraceae bacterium]|nr:CPBP family intramembrane metalloprotease [Desulfobacteraceae bacterium]